MSSSPSTPQSTTCVMSPHRAVSYRQTNYYDGEYVRIAESRRRSHVISPKASATSVRLPSSASKLCRASTDSVSTTTRASDVRPMFPDREPRPEKHVTSKSSRTKARAVIVQAPVPIKPSKPYSLPQVDVRGMSTPPPTPKIERLPTPDLDHLVDRPFCDCCVDAHVIKYCASCGNEMKNLRH